MIGTGSSEKDNRMFKICPKFVLYVLPGTLAIVHDRETMAPVAWVQRFTDLKYRQRWTLDLDRGRSRLGGGTLGGFRRLRRAN